MSISKRLRELADRTGLDGFAEELRALADEAELPVAGEVTDEQINAVALEQWGPHTGAPLAAHRAFARAILALRPVQVPMTDDGVDAKCLTIIGHLLSRRERDRIVWRMAEAHHGITAQAKKETP